jgi:Tat protein secretion system quality control protein TatD with DNase activity
MKAQILTVMSSRSQDQDLVAHSARTYPITGTYDIEQPSSKHVIPAFGWHPWFSHQIYDDRNQQSSFDVLDHYRTVLTPTPDDEAFIRALPTPIPLSKYLEDTENRLLAFPLALIGEVGLDRAFRLPFGEFLPMGDHSNKTDSPDEEYTPGSRQGRPLSPHRVTLNHQKMVLRALFQLAGKHHRPVSVHSVQTHGAIFNLLQMMWKGHERPSNRARKKSHSDAHEMQLDDKDSDMPKKGLPYPPRICMHSYSGPPDALKQFLAPSVPADIYFSFSSLINFSSSTDEKSKSVIKALPDDRILIESDFHCAGERMDQLLKDVTLTVCSIKGWELKQGVKQLKENYLRFIFG